jgi:hypothetical protein
MSTTKKNQPKESVELSIVNNIDNIPAILEGINGKIATIKLITDRTYKTSMNLEGFGDLSKSENISNLIKAFSVIRTREVAYNEAAKELEVNTYPQFEIGGGNAEAWKGDISLRIQIIKQADTLSKLEQARDEMKQFLSQEDQKKMAAQKIQDLLKGL